MKYLVIIFVNYTILKWGIIKTEIICQFQTVASENNTRFAKLVFLQQSYLNTDILLRMQYVSLNIIQTLIFNGF